MNPRRKRRRLWTLEGEEGGRRRRRGFGLGKSVRGSEDDEELEDVRTQDMKE